MNGIGNDLISVIVPVYNGEQYIDTCIKSILNQTYKNLEVILIDDGSIDSSAEKCDQWQQKDHRIRVVHQPNGGLSNARNTGLKLSAGKYTAFVDIDDYIHPQMYEALYALICRYGLDMAVCSYKMTENSDVRFDEYDLSSLTESAEVFTGEEALNRFIEYYQVRIRVPVWCKLYRARLIKEIGFVEGKIHEDEILFHHIVGSCNKIGIINAVLYYYYQSDGSIMRSEFSINRFDVLYALRDRFFYFKERGSAEQVNGWGKYYIVEVLKQWHEVRRKHPELADYYRENQLRQLYDDRDALAFSCRLSAVTRLKLRNVYRYASAVDLMTYNPVIKAYRKLKEILNRK